jgi:hypothetical protein
MRHGFLARLAKCITNPRFVREECADARHRQLALAHCAVHRGGAAYIGLVEKRLPKALAAVAAAAIVAAAFVAAAFVAYTYMYRALGFPLWMRWLT